MEELIVENIKLKEENEILKKKQKNMLLQIDIKIIIKKIKKKLNKTQKNIAKKQTITKKFLQKRKNNTQEPHI